VPIPENNRGRLRGGYGLGNRYSEEAETLTSTRLELRRKTSIMSPVSANQKNRFHASSASLGFSWILYIRIGFKGPAKFFLSFSKARSLDLNWQDAWGVLAGLNCGKKFYT